MKRNEHIHFVGIGGIGVSSLAKYWMFKGAKVTGSDLSGSEITSELEAQGALVFIGKHKKENLPQGVTLVIRTAAANMRNPEILHARSNKIPLMSYPQALGELTKEYDTITVSGAHGKSTTTAMISLILTEGYFDPTVIVGTKVKQFGNSNFRHGKGSHLVLEADEWNKSFLNYHPQVAVITNIDAEHLDTYKNIREVEKTFSKFLTKVPEKGRIVANADDPRTLRIAKKFGKKVVWYSLKDSRAKAISRVLKVPGKHNLSNALAAAAVGKILGISDSVIISALSKFEGTWRRFEFKGWVKGAGVFDDYGHHPREILATITAARNRFPFQRIWCVFQPHQHQRLAFLWKDFLQAFDMADRVCLLPVYGVAGREAASARNKVSSEKLALSLRKRGKNAHHCSSFSSAKEYLLNGVRRGDIVLVMGAGDIYKLSAQITSL